ncbi:MAG: hypothetical protein LUD71_03035 [Clostridiales bacterium]|nr:hypothetical protein [Clostridiales bacterium]
MATKKTIEAAAETTETAAENTITAKVIRVFKDKNTGKVYKVGDKIKVTEERYKEILKFGKYVREV